MSTYKFIGVYKSNNKDKKFDAIFRNEKTGRDKKVSFGASEYDHYTNGHLDERRKNQYILRHINNENWEDPMTPGYWAFHYLWRFKNYREAYNSIIKDLKKKGYL